MRMIKAVRMTQLRHDLWLPVRDLLRTHGEGKLVVGKLWLQSHRGQEDAGRALHMVLEWELRREFPCG